MITTKDVINSHDEIHSIWALGMHENSMTKNEIIKANIQEIANDIMSRREGFVFRLSGVLLCGIARLYSKKSQFFLIDCEEAIARISLRFEIIENKKKQKKGDIEIDEDTAKLWQGENNLESIIEQEQREEPNNSQVELVINSYEDNTSPNAYLVNSYDNDFGNTPFEISACPFEEIPLSGNIQSFGPDNDDPIPPPYESDNYDNDNNNLEKKEETVKSKKNWLIIDQTPIIPLTQLSVSLEDTSKIVVQRPITKTAICTFSYNYDIIKDDLICEIKKIIEKVPVFNGEKYSEDEEIFDSVIDLPPDFDQGINSFFDDSTRSNDDPNDFEQEDDFRNQVFSIDIISDVKRSLGQKSEEELLNIVPDHSRRSLALSFFTALSLKNRGFVELKQSSEISVSLSKGPNFNSLFRK